MSGKRYRSEEGLSRRKETRRHPRPNQMKSKIFHLPSAYVSETEEEESDESDKVNKGRIKVMSLRELS